MPCIWCWLLSELSTRLLYGKKLMLGCRWNTSLATGLYCTVTHSCLLYRYIQELHVKHQYEGDTLERNMAENKAQLTQKIAEIRPLEMAEALEPLNTSAGLFRGPDTGTSLSTLPDSDNTLRSMEDREHF